ncbi:MAG TPA: branched-chain amino acid ABC transporter permease [Ktedonobacterales bacterium]|nr:branched-chain amino acid ABC transporter permease [Ktedonobacterales bacterium]
MASEAEVRGQVVVGAPVPAPRESRGWLWSTLVGLGILALIGILAPLAGDFGVLRMWTLIVMYIVLAQGWNFIGGFVGYAAFGNVVFFGIGAYSVGIFLLNGKPFLLGVAAGFVAAGLFAFLLGLPVLRLRGHYFAIATLGIAEALGEFIAAKDIGGPGGEVSLTPPGGGLGVFTLFFYAFLGLAVLTLLGTTLLTRSRFGYALVAIRENEEAAESLGIATYWYKVGAFVLSALPTAIAGGLWAYWSLGFEPGGEGGAFDVNISVAMVLMTFLGGAGTIVGPVLGAIIIEWLDLQTTLSATQIHGPLLGLLIVLVTLFLPQGLIRLVQELVPGASGTGERLSWSAQLRRGMRRVRRFIAANGV